MRSYKSRRNEFVSFIFVACLAIFATALQAQTVTIAEYSLPNSGSNPSRIVPGPDGALWFTEFAGNKIGRITTTGAITEFIVPTAQSEPTGIASGADGALWFTEQAKNKIGRLATGGVFTEYPLTSATINAPVSIIAGPDGALWFTESGGNRIGRITTSGTINEFSLPTLDSNPVGVVFGIDGALWFTEQKTNKIGRMTTAGSFTEFSVPTASSLLVAIAAGPDGALWFTEQLGNKIGRITTAGAFTEYPLPTSGANLGAIVNGPDGALWFTELTGNKIGRITTGGAITEYPVPTNASNPNGIITGPDGNLWFTETVGNKIGKAVETFVGGTLLGTLGHVVSEGGWNTRMVLVNLGTSVAETHLKFYGEAGADLPLPVASVTTGNAGIVSSLDQILAPNNVAMFDSAGTGAQTSQSGSAQVSGDPGTTGFGIFSFPAFKWDAVVPLESRNASSYLLAFDNTGAIATGLAIANVSAQPATVPVIVRNDQGQTIRTAQIILAARGHNSFMLTAYPETVGIRGTIEFDTPPGGQISVLGVRANGSALTTLPVLANVGTAGGAIAHSTYNFGFTSTYYLVNTGSSAATFTLNFFDEATGQPLQTPLSLPQTSTSIKTTSLTRSMPAGSMLEIDTQADDALPLIQGAAELTTDGNISGFEVFRWTTFGVEASVPLETRSPASFVLVFDNAGGLTTGLALSNVTGQGANVTVNLKDETGQPLQSATIPVAAHGHTSFMLPDQYASSAGKRGTVEFVTPVGGRISVIGVRARPDGRLTTIPVLAK